MRWGGGVAARAQNIASFEKRITVSKLPNGLTLIVYERPEAPVFSFYTLVNAGPWPTIPRARAASRTCSSSIAFKGTSTPSVPPTTRAEKIALAKVEAAYAAYDAEFRKRIGQDPAKLASLKTAFDAAQAEAQKYVIPNQFAELAEKNGAVGLNASTGEDSTQYFFSMPSNRFELWAYMESSRIGHPVAREFWLRNATLSREERRMRIDSNPEVVVWKNNSSPQPSSRITRGTSGVGWESDISQVSATEADAFHKKYYVPANIVIAVVGDLKASEAMPILTKYFGPIPAGPKPEAMTTVEPPQFAERSVVVHEATQPFYMEGYHRPDYRDPDDSVYDAISDILSNGRTGRLYRSLPGPRSADRADRGRRQRRAGNQVSQPLLFPGPPVARSYE